MRRSVRLASVENDPGQIEIRRENLQRDVAVTGRLEGLSLGKGIELVKSKVASLHIPSAIRVVYGGLYPEQQQSFHDLLFVLAAAIVLVFIVLLMEFNGFAAPIAILASALLSTSGVVFALFITRTTFSISSFMGLIMVIGIVAKNGILLLDADQRFRAEGATAAGRHDRGGRTAASSHFNDGPCHRSRNDSAGARVRRRLPDAATASDRRDWGNCRLHGPVSGGNSGSSLLFGSQVRVYLLTMTMLKLPGFTERRGRPAGLA